MTTTQTPQGKDLTADQLGQYPDFDNHERIFDCRDPDTGLHAIIAIHSTKLGNALGGCRMWGYVDESRAITDALRLSRGMSYKHAVAETPFGGGKAVIIADSRKVAGEERAAMFQSFGRFVEQVAGQYITAEDVGTSPTDIVHIHKNTNHVVGLPLDMGGTGDPSPMTAYGTYCGIQASVQHMAGKPFDSEGDLSGVTVAVQGLGHVGQFLCEFLHERGAKLIVADIHEEKLTQAREEFGATVVEPDAIYGADADVFAPCAMGAILNPDTLDTIKAKIIAGASNNQLSTMSIADDLMNRGVLYAPDYVINAGGVINISYESGGNYQVEVARAHTRRIGEILMTIYERAKSEGRSTARVADEIAEEKLH